jgi:hypothetical protein
VRRSRQSDQRIDAIDQGDAIHRRLLIGVLQPVRRSLSARRRCDRRPMLRKSIPPVGAPLAVAGEERAELPLQHRCSRDNRSDGGDHDHSQCEPCGPCPSLLAHLRTARVIDQPLLCMRAGVQPRAGEKGTSPVIGDQVVVIGGTQGRCYSGRACCVPASVPSVSATRPGRRKWGVFHFKAFPSLPLSPPHLPPRSATVPCH